MEQTTMNKRIITIVKSILLGLAISVTTATANEYEDEPVLFPELKELQMPFPIPTTVCEDLPDCPD
jgi:hypothetical protein